MTPAAPALPPTDDLLRTTDRGLYCAAGDFHIDPWLPVEQALITHAHGDHARWGSRRLASSRPSGNSPAWPR